MGGCERRAEKQTKQMIYVPRCRRRCRPMLMTRVDDRKDVLLFLRPPCSLSTTYRTHTPYTPRIIHTSIRIAFYTAILPSRFAGITTAATVDLDTTPAIAHSRHSHAFHNMDGAE